MKTSEQINENICVALGKQTALLEQVKYWCLNICFWNFYFWLIKMVKVNSSPQWLSTDEFHLIQN